MYETIFRICNTVALLSWLLLIVFPRAKLTRYLVERLIVPLAFAVAYALLVAGSRSAFAAGGGFSSLAQVKTLFSFPAALLAGWLHYLAFDLFVGSRISRDRQRLGIGAYAVAPALVATFMFGPLGLLVYALQRRVVIHRSQRGLHT